MPKKLTINEVCDYLNNINLELIGEYILKKIKRFKINFNDYLERE